jgi:hypothetical protein
MAGADAADYSLLLNACQRSGGRADIALQPQLDHMVGISRARNLPRS